MADKLYKRMANVIAKTVKAFREKTRNEIAVYLQNLKTMHARNDDLNDVVTRIEKICTDYSGMDIVKIENDLNSLPAKDFEDLYQDIPLLSKIKPEERREQTRQEKGNNSFGTDRVGKWIEAYLSGKIDASIFSCLIVLEKLLHKKLTSEVKTTINLAIKCLVYKGHWSPKEEQDMKHALNDLETVINADDSDSVILVLEKISDMLDIHRR
ncbi:hypothetical protein FACS1894137_07100 [Spirochaetia bacterium]|nr:hypothetical protein FACS1894137_07100 [Spirochaetia bacterium]